MTQLTLIAPDNWAHVGQDQVTTLLELNKREMFMNALKFVQLIIITSAWPLTVSGWQGKTKSGAWLLGEQSMAIVSHFFSVPSSGDCGAKCSALLSSLLLNTPLWYGNGIRSGAELVSTLEIRN